jgi:hypothetical protein
MPNQVSMGAMMTCTFGAAPSSLVVLPKNKVLAEGECNYKDTHCNKLVKS